MAERLKEYKEFSTIDWVNDRRRDRIRNKRINTAQLGTFAPLFESIQAYILIISIGICIGLAASQINTLSAWLTDVKSGFCVGRWYLSKRLCCLPLNTCPSWNDWSFTMFKVSDIYIIRWISY